VDVKLVHLTLLHLTLLPPGYEVGRYWLLERNDGSYCPGGAKTCPTQQYYHIPVSWLHPAGENSPPNLLVLFDMTGATDITSVGLATSGMKSSDDLSSSAVDPTQVISCEF
jgi:hypothetical protein